MIPTTAGLGRFGAGVDAAVGRGYGYEGKGCQFRDSRSRQYATKDSSSALHPGWLGVIQRARGGVAGADWATRARASASSYTNKPEAGLAVCAKLSPEAFCTLSMVGSARPSSTSSVTRRLFLASLAVLSGTASCVVFADVVVVATDDGRPWPMAPRFFGLAAVLPLPFDEAFFGGAISMAAPCSGDSSRSLTGATSVATGTAFAGAGSVTAGVCEWAWG